MAGPPNSVAIAAPIPNQYFGTVTGLAATIPTVHTQLGHAQPVVATPPVQVHPNPIGNAAGIGGPLPVDLGPARGYLPPAFAPPTLPPGLFQPVPGTIFARFQRFMNAGQFTNPVSYWQRQIASLRFGRSTIGG